MLGVLCARPRPLLLSYAHCSLAAPLSRWIANPPPPYPLLAVKRNVSASIWHAILPYGWRQWRRRSAVVDHEGVNVAWDARAARWLHQPDSAWLLFGLTLAAPVTTTMIDSNSDAISDSSSDGFENDVVDAAASVVGDNNSSANYRITGVPADGRCLFRAIAHTACLRNGEDAPDENRQTELADELRAQVVEELLTRRKEVEWFIEEDFDEYVKMIQQPYVWGGEPELVMSSHVLRAPISVFMKETSSGSLVKIADYGEEYDKDEENHINVLFHGYGHYDILETIPDSRRKVVNA